MPDFLLSHSLLLSHPILVRLLPLVLDKPIVYDCQIAVHLIFRFVTGFCGSAFLSVAGGSVTDLFRDSEVAGCAQMAMHFKEI